MEENFDWAPYSPYRTRRRYLDLPLSSFFSPVTDSWDKQINDGGLAWNWMYPGNFDACINAHSKEANLSGKYVTFNVLKVDG